MLVTTISQRCSVPLNARSHARVTAIATPLPANVLWSHPWHGRHMPSLPSSSSSLWPQLLTRVWLPRVVAILLWQIRPDHRRRYHDPSDHWTLTVSSDQLTLLPSHLHIYTRTFTNTRMHTHTHICSNAHNVQLGRARCMP